MSRAYTETWGDKQPEPHSKWPEPWMAARVWVRRLVLRVMGALTIDKQSDTSRSHSANGEDASTSPIRLYPRWVSRQGKELERLSRQARLLLLA